MMATIVWFLAVMLCAVSTSLPIWVYWEEWTKTDIFDNLFYPVLRTTAANGTFFFSYDEDERQEQDVPPATWLDG